MRRWTELLQSFGRVVTLDYDYIKAGGRRPDPLPKLIAAHRRALATARTSHHGPIALIGKSMGSRVGCHVALEEPVPAVICLGYPLCGGGDRTKLRDKVLRASTTPILFVQGTRDSLCPLDLLLQVRSEMKAPNELHVVDGGDHSLLVTKKQLAAAGETQADIDDRIVAVLRDFLSRQLRNGTG